MEPIDDQEAATTMEWARYSDALLRDIRNIQFGGEFTSKQKDTRADSYYFLGKLLRIGRNSTGQGSALLLNFGGKKYFVTAKHCITGQYGNSNVTEVENFDIYILIQGKRFHFKKSDFDLTSKYDITFAPYYDKIKTDLFLDHIYTEIEVGDPVQSYGFPDGEFFFSGGKIIKYEHESIEHTATTFDGASGGLLAIDSRQGKLIAGVLSVRISPKSQEIKNFLEDRSYQPLFQAVSSRALANFILRQTANKN